ncbi:tetratricopeptide repeat protein [Flavobacterium nitratireducens]|uniref:type IX secretion system periplasmic lipoprotein PorW/SprE n=1 Tax=Flavobacterium nitratireducens TaxID=992289 RepID=UPI002414ECB2|nr:hypothetical protein [Flavobacterium nitratireducens]
MANLPSENSFYFYNPNTVSFGKVAFKKNWGKRTLGGYWRLSSTSSLANQQQNDSTAVVSEEATAGNPKPVEEVNPRYTPDFYIGQLPTATTAIDSIAKERNDAYYQLGVIYKEKFKENELAAKKLEQLLSYQPEEKLVLPIMYHLYKIYQTFDSEKAETYRSKILAQYPDSRYAQILNNANVVIDEGSPEVVYKKIYQQYLNEEFDVVMAKIDGLINQFSGEEIVSKLELLKANTIGKQNGLAAYKAALENVASNYPNTEEGKNATSILAEQIPLLENKNFEKTASKNWKILYPVAITALNDKKTIEEKIAKFIQLENTSKMNVSYQNYDATSGFVIVQGISSQDYANYVASMLKENPTYKMETAAIVISNENYNLVQMKKNLNLYLEFKKQ